MALSAAACCYSKPDSSQLRRGSTLLPARTVCMAEHIFPPATPPLHPAATSCLCVVPVPRLLVPRSASCLMAPRPSRLIFYHPGCWTMYTTSEMPSSSRRLGRVALPCLVRAHGAAAALPPRTAAAQQRLWRHPKACCRSCRAVAV